MLSINSFEGDPRMEARRDFNILQSMNERQGLYKPEVLSDSELLSPFTALGIPLDYMRLYPQNDVSLDVKRALIVLSSGGSSPDHPVIDAALQASTREAVGLRVPLAHHIQEDIGGKALARLVAGMPLEAQVILAAHRIAKEKPLIVGGQISRRSHRCG